VDGTYLFGATLLYKVNASTSARMSGRLVLNGTTEIRGSRGEISGAHVSEATALWLQTMVALTAGDTVELQGNFRAADGYFAADQTSFWGARSAEGGAPWPHKRPRSISATCARCWTAPAGAPHGRADRRPRDHHRVLLALLAGVAIKLKVFGNGP
jgi:hypothetical protein